MATSQQTGYEPDQYYEGTIASADPGEYNGSVFIECYVRGPLGGINGRMWINEDKISDFTAMLQGYGLSLDQIGELPVNASSLVGKPCRFKTKLREYVDKQTGEMKSKVQIAFFVEVRRKPAPPSAKTQSRLKSLLRGEAPPAASEPPMDDAPIPGDNDLPF